MADPINYSKTQRIVLLLDLHPLLTLQSPKSYLTTVLAAAKHLLTFPPLSASLFALKLFFSSLSPLRSSSAVHRLLPNSSKSLTSLSFNLPSQTLEILSNTLDSLSLAPSFSSGLENSSPRASHTCSALLQLVHDYAWESEIEISTDDFPCIRSNLVVLFSPICKTSNILSEYMNVDLDSEYVTNLDKFLLKFRTVFSAVNDAYITRDIHFSWVDVCYQFEVDDDKVRGNECGAELGFFEKGIKSFNWGYCSSDAIFLGSALIPFHLVYPKIGIPWNFWKFDYMPKKRGVQLNLEILDVNGKPLECNYCDLELLNLRTCSSIRSDDILNALESKDSKFDSVDGGETPLSQFGGGMKKLQVKSLYRYNGGLNIEGFSFSYFLVREFFGESKRSKKKCSEELVADKVLDILSHEPCEICQVNCTPLWQILLNFLHNRGYWALVSISNEKGDTSIGILKPFTANYALLSVMEHGSVQVCDFSGSDPTNTTTKNRDHCLDVIDMEGIIASQTDTSKSGNCESLANVKRRKSKKHLKQDLTWCSFRNEALECSHFNLTEVYFAGHLNKSKKLKFLKCWLKQIRKCTQDSFSAVPASKNQQEQVVRSNFPKQLQMVEEVLSVQSSETSESFFGSLFRRIQHGLQSKMDLQILAERLVRSSICWLCQIKETDKDVAEKSPNRDVPCGDTAFLKLTKLLLKDPKKMKEMREHNDPSSKDLEHNQLSTNIIREYELQIFLRMEILRSVISGSIKDTAKHTLLKQICSLLEIMQYLVEGGIHGQVKLFDYVEQNIKSRYFDDLEDAVNEIYTQMDLLPFGDDDEAQILLLNSEDSNQSWRDRQDGYEKAEMPNIHQTVSAEDDSYQAPDSVDESIQETGEEDHARKLSEAQERREKSRRFVSFTSRMPDLQRVWAPKQSKAVKGTLEPLKLKSKRKNREVSDSVVCETPLSGRKRPCSRSSEGDEEEYTSHQNSFSVSKALFQD